MAHIIVFGNEKGGSGKTTTSMHVVVALLKSGFEVATIPVGAVLDPKAMTPEHLADIDRARALPIEGLTESLELTGHGEQVVAHRFGF